MYVIILDRLVSFSSLLFAIALVSTHGSSGVGLGFEECDSKGRMNVTAAVGDSTSSSEDRRWGATRRRRKGSAKGAG